MPYATLPFPGYKLTSAAVLRLRSSEWIRSFAVVSSATFSAQVAAFAWTPFLTRLYDPAAFGAFSVFISMVMPFALCSSLRLEQAIVLVAEDSEASNLFIVCCLLVAVSAAIVGLVALLLTPGAFRALLIAIGVLASGLSQPLVALCSRYRAFKTTSCSHIVRAITIILAQAAGVIAGASSLGLVLGYICGEVAATAVLLGRVLSSNWPPLRLPEAGAIRALIRRQRDFPLYSTPQTLLNTASQSLPAFFLAAAFGTPAAGAYWLAVRVLVVPSTLLRQAFGQVYYEHACRLNRVGTSVYPVLRSATLILAIASCVVAGTAVVAAPRVFTIVFGTRWMLAGQYATLLVPWTAAAFANLPSVSLLPILGRQRFALCYDIVGLLARTAALAAGVLVHSHVIAIAAYSGIGFLFNVVLIAAVFHFSRHHDATGVTVRDQLASSQAAEAGTW